MRKQKHLRRFALLAALATGASTAMAGTAKFEFTTDPLAGGQVESISGTTQNIWRDTGGNPGGYIAITDSINGMNGKVVFKDFDGGLIVKAFKLSADVRIGNAVGNGGRPADGFSISYAREGDPALDDANFNDFAVGGAPENGTKTGLAIGFDTWSGNALPDGPDLEGIIVRVDNETVLRYPMPTRNGSCTDITSLQTGPWVDGSEGVPDGLCWAKVEVELDEEGKLTVKYKGATLLNAAQTTYSASKGRLVLAGRTGGANENHHIDNIEITTVPADKVVVGSIRGNAAGFKLTVNDNGQSIADTASVKTKLNGVEVTSTVTKAGGITTASYSGDNFFAAGSTNTVDVELKDTQGAVVKATRKFVVAPYAILDENNATTDPVQSRRGFRVQMHQIDAGRGPGDANSIQNAETQLADGFIDPATGNPYDNIADLSTAEQGFIIDGDVINWNQDAPGNAGNFNSGNGFEDEPIPGIPGATSSTDNVAAAITTILDLKRGVYRFGVNSDDGFRVTVSKGVGDVFGTMLGSFNGGRGASDSLFDFVVTKEGKYPFRLSWWEGGGGANVEFFMVTPDDKKVLINTEESGIRAFAIGRGAAYIKSLLPWPGRTGVSETGPIKAVLVDDASKVDKGSIRIKLDGQEFTPALSTQGANTTVTYTPATKWELGSRHTGSLEYKLEGGTAVRSIPLDFTVRPVGVRDFANGAFIIEAEHFNFDGGKFKTEVDGKDYTGTEYDQLEAVFDVDYNQGGGTGDGGSKNYRLPSKYESSTHSPMNANTGGNNVNNEPVVLRKGKTGEFNVEANFKIGWVDGAEWYNYTRNIPAGKYFVYGAQSHGDPAGTANRLVATLHEVTSDVSKPNQTLSRIGSYSEPATGGWGPNAVSQFKDAKGEPVVYFSKGGTKSFRFYPTSGDFDWFAFVPAAVGTLRPLVQAQPAGTLKRDATLTFSILDRETTVKDGSVKLKLNGNNVTPQVSKSGDVTQVSYKPAEIFPAESMNAYELAFEDSANTAVVATGGFSVSVLGTPGTFVIEAEDFNYEKGKTKAEASTMPYAGAAYNGLEATDGIDFRRSGGTDDAGSKNYRTPALYATSKHVPMNNNNGDRDRGTFTLTGDNYKIGWADGDGWYNYTRTIPKGTYQVWAGLSHGDGPGNATAISGRLSTVTGDVTTTNQTATVVGTFSAPGTGGWGANTLVPLKANPGDTAHAVLSLDGVTTLRATVGGGDYDYLLLIPASAPVGAPKVAVTRGSDGKLTIIFEGSLLSADEASGPWTPVTGATSPRIVDPTAARKFYRSSR